MCPLDVAQDSLSRSEQHPLIPIFRSGTAHYGLEHHYGLEQTYSYVQRFCNGLQALVCHCILICTRHIRFHPVHSDESSTGL